MASGRIIGFIAGRAILSVSYPWLVGRLLTISWFSQVRAAIRPLVTTVLLFGAAIRIESFLAASSWLGLVVAAVATAGIALPLAYYAGLSSSQRAGLLKRARRAAGAGAKG